MANLWRRCLFCALDDFRYPINGREGVSKVIQDLPVVNVLR